MKSFPTAEGYGKFARGGRGGAVFIVDTLNDSGTGSLRACVEGSGARTCVFSVSGDIVVNSPLEINNPFITIAGQTSPGGINLKAGPTMTRTPLFVLANDVIIRHLRLRPGRGALTNPGGAANALDALGVFPPAHNVMLDHLSMAWAVDEAINIYGPNVTLQWSIIAETLKNHSKGSVMWGNGQSYLHNLTAHNLLRNPDFTGGRIDFVNNILYNGGARNGEFYNRREPLSLNFVGNLSIMGVDTASAIVPMDFFGYESTGVNPISFYFRDNIDWFRTSSSAAQDAAVDPADRQWISPTVKNGGLSVPASSDARQAALDTLAFVGANLPSRDSADQRIIASVRNCAGTAITDPSNVGGFPVFPSIAAPADADRDGMADSWETAVGLSPSNAADRNLDADGDGYTNLEEYLNELAGDQTRAGAVIQRTGTGTGSLPADLSCGRSPGPAPVSSPAITITGSGGGASNSKFFTVSPGTPVTINWSVTSADTCTLSANVKNGSTNLPVPGFTGSVTHTPTEATQYKMACTRGVRFSHEAVAVGLTTSPYFADGAENAPRVTVTANPATITAGQSATISWSATNATSCVPVHVPTGSSVAPFSLATGTSGAVTVSPTATTQYAVTCLATENQMTAVATLTVN